jgi:hypothetical protein
MRLEELGIFRNLMSSLGNELATFPLAAKCLNQLGMYEKVELKSCQNNIVGRMNIFMGRSLITPVLQDDVYSQDHVII